MSLLDTASLIVTPNGYKEGKLYSVIPSDGSGDLSVTRATTATRVNSAGLVELVPYNLFSYSEQFDQSYWLKSSSTIVADNTTAPNGTNTADKLTISGGFGAVYVASLALEGYHSISCYFKKGTSAKVYIDTNGTSGNLGAGFNLDTASIVSTWGGATANIENVGNGWYHISIYALFTGTTSYIAFGIQEPTSGLDAFIWGAQLNEGTIKPYQKTETRLNIPRLDYSNGTCPSILVEPQRTNLLIYSSSFDNAVWGAPSNVVANSVISPSGIQDADTLTGGLYRLQVFSATSYVFSFYAKKNTSSTFAMRVDAPTNNTFNFNLDTGVADSGATMEAVGNGWYRCYMPFTSGFAGTGVFYPNVNNDNLYIWGAQLEAGSYATSYIPTTSASVTRNADVISKTGISSLIGQTEGTIFLDFVLKNPLSATNRIISITESNWLSGGSIRLDIDYNKFTADFVNGGSNIGNIGYFTTVQPNTRYKVAIAYKENDCQMYINGVDAGSDTTTAAMPTCSELYLNALGGGFNAPYEASNINASALWKTRLTNAQLATLTTI